jgi:hypothetical protein
MKCIAPTAGQGRVGLDHNGAPDDAPRTVDELAMHLYKMIGPRTDTAIELFECGAPWTGYASDGDLKRLGKLQARINRRAQSDKEDKAERKRIMDKNIKRMRRANGKK